MLTEAPDEANSSHPVAELFLCHILPSVVCIMAAGYWRILSRFADAVSA